MPKIEKATGRRDVDLLRFLTCGSVDDGKSTLIGRLLYDTKLLFDDQLAALEEADVDEIDFASLVDGLEAEREQGITIDVAYRFFATATRRFIVADTPGHEQYTRNMATGASTADLAVILIDARKGVLTQTLRHTIIASLMGIRHVVLAVNKMDLVDFDRSRFDEIVAAYRDAVATEAFAQIMSIPVSAKLGDNVVRRSDATAWYDGPTLLEALETASVAQPDRPLRFPVQWVNRPHQDFRGFSGTLAGGSLEPGDTITVARSGETAAVERIVTMDGDLDRAIEGDAVTLTLDREIDISRGDLLSAPKDRPFVADQFAADIVWMSADALIPGRQYIAKTGYRTLAGSVTELRHRLDVNSGEHLAAKTLELNEVGRCNLALVEPIAFDAYEDNRRSGSFILIDRFSNETVGAGMIRFPLRRASNVHWQALSIDGEARAALLGQTPRMIWFTGLSGAGKSTIANIVEKKLHAMGRHTYTLDGDNVRHGLNKDLGFTDADRVENIRRVAEVGRLMVDAGLIVLVSFISPFRAERRMARDLIGDRFVEVFVHTPLEIAEARDPKGLYAKARAGKLKNFTGIDSPYEPPLEAEITLDTTSHTAEVLADQVIEAILTR